MIAVSTRADWEDEGRFTDDYSEEAAAFIADAFNGCGFEAYEAMESMFELDGMDADTAREALRGVPGFTHSFEFEAAASGTV
jgi:hypothetical protein